MSVPNQPPPGTPSGGPFQPVTAVPGAPMAHQGTIPPGARLPTMAAPPAPPPSAYQAPGAPTNQQMVQRPPSALTAAISGGPPPTHMAAVPARPMPPSGGMKRPSSHVTVSAMAAAHQSRVQAASGKKKRRIGDKIIPVEVRELVPESQAYMDLLSFEKKLDATITRKKLDIQEALKRPMKVKRRLRIYVSHTFYAGKEPEKDGEEGSVPMWELRVEGRLLDEYPQGSASGTAGSSGSQNKQSSSAQNLANTAGSSGQQNKKKFSSFFKSLVIELDKDIYGPDNHLVEWHRTNTTNETDGFQVKRPGDRNVKCTILLLLDYQPMKFKVNPRLAKILGVHTETRPKIIEALWQYIKTHKLQDATERDHINCDEYLSQIFNCRRMRFMEIPQRLHGLLQQPDPIVINHIITVEGTDPKKTACYDIDVEIEDPLKQQMSQFVLSQTSFNEIQQLDNKIYETVEQLNEWKTRRDFYLKFAENPQEFIQKWLISQSRDLKTMSDLQGQPESERRAEHYFQPCVEESVFRYFYNKVQQRRAELEQNLGVKHN